MDPPPPAEVLDAADGLRYRDFMTVALVVPEETAFPDNWIYIHDPGVKVGRIQNFGAWSPYLVKDGRTCLGLEFFVNEGDDMWTKSDEDLIAQGKRELEQLGLVDAVARSRPGYVVRMPKAYPVYDDALQGRTSPSCAIGSRSTRPNVYPVGRNGMHKYNNQDHSMYTAMLSVENIFGAHHDVWTVNVEDGVPRGARGRVVARPQREWWRRARHWSRGAAAAAARRFVQLVRSEPGRTQQWSERTPVLGGAPCPANGSRPGSRGGLGVRARRGLRAAPPAGGGALAPLVCSRRVVSGVVPRQGAVVRAMLPGRGC